MIEAFYRTPEGKQMYRLVKAFNFKILPDQFRDMTKNQINELLVIRELMIKETELANVRR